MIMGCRWNWARQTTVDFALVVREDKGRALLRTDLLRRAHPAAPPNLCLQSAGRVAPP